MSVKKVDHGYAVVHCHGKNKGKQITKKYMTKARAMAVHRAIQANKAQKG